MPNASSETAAGRKEKPAAEGAPPDPSSPDAIQNKDTAKIGSVTRLNEVVPVGHFLLRHGATEINMRRAVIKESAHGYPRILGSYIFDHETGEIAVRGEAPEPTEAEQEEMAAAIRRCSFPKEATLAAIGDPPDGVDASHANTFVCYDFDNRIVCLRERQDHDDGTKSFRTWTYWSDGKWRNMEPETLPFYNLPGAKDNAILYIHEGEKACRGVVRAIKDEDHRACPWLDVLSCGHHIGWLGGAYAIDRSNWEKLAQMGWSEVVVVADNDSHGLRAARRIASFFPGEVFVLCFDQRFESGFDLGDDWPETLFDKKRRYVGPSLQDCLRLAMRATTLIPSEGRGRPTAIVRPEFANHVAYTVDPPRFILSHRPSHDLSADEFNSMVRPFSDVKDTASKVQGQIECQHDKLIYDPGHSPGTINRDGQKCYNVHERPRFQKSATDDALWIAYLEHLIPDGDERHLVMRWLATLIARPDIRIRYGLLLISETQGVGKNTLGSILKGLLGSSNVSFPSEHSVVTSQFNGWLARRVLVFISEFYSGASRKAYDKLKSVIADDIIEVNIKNVNQHTLDNFATVIACSNSLQALHLDDEDRRWLVPAVAEHKMSNSWWKALYVWLDGEGLAAIATWADRYASEHGPVETGNHAPSTKRKRQIVEDSMSEGKLLARDFGEHLAAMDKKFVVTVKSVRELIAYERGFKIGDQPDLGHRHLEKPATITAVLKKVAGLTVWAGDDRRKVGGRMEALVMNFSPEGTPDESWADVREYLATAEGVGFNDAM